MGEIDAPASREGWARASSAFATGGSNATLSFTMSASNQPGMQSFFEWLNGRPELRARPWLMLGKGPSFGRLSDFDVSGFEKLSLNHVVRELPVTVAHIIDVDVVSECADALRSNAQKIVMPWQPHRNNWVASPTLLDWINEIPVLAELRGQGRLLWYNLSTGKAPRPGSPIVSARYFSAEAALCLLGEAGVGKVWSLGVDGGSSYSATFNDIAERTKLSNGWQNFDRQFEEFPRIMMRTGVDYAPLDQEAPIRVFVAATESERLPMKVLEYSIRKHCSMAVRVEALCDAGIEVPIPRDPSARPRTPFSFQRFLIPERAGRVGKAIYLDADMQLFADIRSLWQTPMGDANILTVVEPTDSGRIPQFSVMLIDCERTDWRIDDIVDRLNTREFSYEDLMYRMSIGGVVSSSIDPAWNSLECYSEGETAILHYTDMNTQPWVHSRHPLGYLWTRDLLEAIGAGYISRELVAEHVARGWVRPSLLTQVDEGINDPLLLGPRARQMDRRFVAPFRSIGRNPEAIFGIGAIARAAARDLVYRTGFTKFFREAVRARSAQLKSRLGLVPSSQDKATRK